MMWRGLICMVVTLWVFTGFSARAGQVINDDLLVRPFSHRIWDEVTSRHVSARGEVDFIRLKARPRRLNQYLRQLAVVSPVSHPDWFPSREHRLAYWINAYNALALRRVLDVYPVDSLREVPGFHTRRRNSLGGKPMSLADIEARLKRYFIMQPDWAVAITDLSRSAPPLLNAAYTPSQLKAQLGGQRRWVVSQQVKVAGDGCATVEITPWLGRFQDILKAESPTHSHLSPFLVWIKQNSPPRSQGMLARPCEHSLQTAAPDMGLRRAP